MLAEPITHARAESRLLLAARKELRRVIIHRSASPLVIASPEKRLLRRAEFSVFDFDDAVYLHQGMRRKVEIMCREATRVIAANEELASYASQYNDDVWLIPTCIESNDYARSGEIVEGSRQFVWIGSPSNEPNLMMIAEPLLQLHRRTGARLTVISSGQAGLGSLDPMVDRVNWRPGIESTLGSYWAGIAPLIDNPWNRGKSAYKMLQYAAAGLPCVASPIGANRIVADLLDNGSADSSAEWLDLLLELESMDPSVRRTVGLQSRFRAEDLFGYRSWLQKWENALALDDCPGE